MYHLNLDIFQEFHSSWALLTAGNPGNFNTMTVSWGGLGTLWGKSVATVYVRPNRHTFSFMESSEHFTLSFYPDEYKKDLALLGKLSGRDTDKVAQTGLTPIAAGTCVTFSQARRTLLCRKLYAQDLDSTVIPNDVKDRFYSSEPVHRMYIGEVIGIL